MVALDVPAGTAPTPFLAPGPFRATWEGDLTVPFRGEYTLFAAGRGTIKVELNGKAVLSGSGDDLSQVEGKPAKLKKGPNKLVVTYDSPAVGRRPGPPGVVVGGLPPRADQHRRLHPRRQDRRLAEGTGSATAGSSSPSCAASTATPPTRRSRPPTGCPSWPPTPPTSPTPAPGSRPTGWPAGSRTPGPPPDRDHAQGDPRRASQGPGPRPRRLPGDPRQARDRPASPDGRAGRRRRAAVRQPRLHRLPHHARPRRLGHRPQARPAPVRRRQVAARRPGRVPARPEPALRLDQDAQLPLHPSRGRAGRRLRLVAPGGRPRRRPAAQGKPAADPDRGRALFASAGCASCHAVAPTRRPRAADEGVALAAITPRRLAARLRRPGERPRPEGPRLRPRRRGRRGGPGAGAPSASTRSPATPPPSSPSARSAPPSATPATSATATTTSGPTTRSRSTSSWPTPRRGEGPRRPALPRRPVAPVADLDRREAPRRLGRDLHRRPARLQAPPLPPRPDARLRHPGRTAWPRAWPWRTATRSSSPPDPPPTRR